MNRRSFLSSAFTGIAALAAGRIIKPALAARTDDVQLGAPPAVAPAPTANNTIEKITKSDAEWKKELPTESYDVLRHEGTERPFTSALNDEHRKGNFHCLGCDLPLFPSSFKFDSGTGWPSFYDAIPNHLETRSDYAMLIKRTEYHCARCGGHHGHIFNDGPKPTGLRYCNNGAALKFIPT